MRSAIYGAYAAYAKYLASIRCVTAPDQMNEMLFYCDV